MVAEARNAQHVLAWSSPPPALPESALDPPAYEEYELGLDRVIVIPARHLYREVRVGPVCNIRYRVRIYSMAYMYVYLCHLLVR